MHPLKLVQIKNPFGILSTNPQIPWEWVGPIFFKKKMFGWDTLVTNHSTTFLTTAIICWTLKLKIAGLRQSRDMSIVVGGGEAEAPLPRL